MTYFRWINRAKRCCFATLLLPWTVLAQAQVEGLSEELLLFLADSVEWEGEIIDPVMMIESETDLGTDAGGKETSTTIKDSSGPLEESSEQ